MHRRSAIVVFLALASTASAKTLRVPQDFPTIPDALDVAKSGDVIRVAPGLHICRAHLQDFDGITIRGAGPDKTRLIVAENLMAMPPTVFDVFHCNDVTIAGLTIEGGSALAVYLTSSRNITIRDIRFKGETTSDPGPVEAFGCENITISRCEFRDYVQPPLNLGFPSFEIGGVVEISNCRFTDLGDDAMIIRANGVVIERNRFVRVAGSAIFVGIGKLVGDARVANNLFENVGSGCQIDSIQYVMLSGNRVRGADTFGLQVQGAIGLEMRSNKVFDAMFPMESDVGGAIVERNRVEHSGNAGIVIQDNGARVARNKLVDNQVAGVRVFGDGVELRGNQVLDAKAAGLIVEMFADDCTLIGNRVVRPAGHGILLNSAMNLLQKNEVRGAGMHGFEVTTTQNTLEKNFAHGSALSDLHCDLQTNTVADNNDFGTVEDIP